MSPSPFSAAPLCAPVAGIESGSSASAPAQGNDGQGHGSGNTDDSNEADADDSRSGSSGSGSSDESSGDEDDDDDEEDGAINDEEAERPLAVLAGHAPATATHSADIGFESLQVPAGLDQIQALLQQQMEMLNSTIAATAAVVASSAASARPAPGDAAAAAAAALAPLAAPPMSSTGAGLSAFTQPPAVAACLASSVAAPAPGLTAFAASPAARLAALAAVPGATAPAIDPSTFAPPMPPPPMTSAQLQQEAQLAALTRAYSTPLAVPAPAVPVLPKVTDLIPELPPVPAGGYTRKEANKLFETLVQVPRRPSWCTTGEPVTVKANSVTIQLTKPDLLIHNYEFRLEPSITGPRLRDAFELWRKEYLPDVSDPGTRVTFDGKRFMYASSALYAIQMGHAREWQVAMAIGGGSGRRGGRGGHGQQQQRLQRVVNIKVKLVGVLPVKDAIDYMQGIVSREHSIFSYTGAVDNIFRTAATSLLTPSGRVLYDRRQKQVTETGLEVVPGYTQAIRTGSDDLLLIVDVTSAVFYEPMPLSDLIKQAFNHNAKHSLTYQEQQQLRRALKSLNVYPTYVESSKRKKYAIQDITTSAADSTFFSLDGVNTSVADYFMREYNIRLQYPHLPCVIAKGGASGGGRGRRTTTTNDPNVPQIYLPIELCMLVPGQKAARSFGNIDHNKFKPSAMAPAERALMIERGLQQIYDPPMDILTAFGLQPTFQLQEIQGRMLEAPKLMYHPDSIEPTIVPEGGKWDLDSHKVYRGVTLERWAVLPFVPCDPIKVAKFIKQWAGRMRDVGIQVLDHQPPILPPADPEADIELAIQHAYLQAGKEVAHPDLLVFILPNKGFALYHGIKRACDVTFGVASQCITLKTVQDSRMLHIDNLCLKVNVKLPNGINVRMDPSYMPCVALIPTMFMGADVTHPAQEIRSPSIASVVGSMDAVGAKYACATRIQPIRMEIILDMGSMVLELLQKFYLQTGTKPQRIIFYRDGISEGQFTEVIRTEVTAIRKAFKALDPNYEPKLTFIIVQKRHHTRFFPLEGAPTDRLGNPMPGLLVDRKVTHPFEFDFYIQSHQTFQGLAKPTRYSVLVDDNHFDPNHLAELSYRSCFLYPRGTRSVSMVPAAFYAHVTAARAKAHVIDGERNGQRFFALSTIKPELEKAMYFM